MKMLVDISWNNLSCTKQARDNLDKILEQVGVERWESYLYEIYNNPIDSEDVADDLHHEWERIFRDLDIE